MSRIKIVFGFTLGLGVCNPSQAFDTMRVVEQGAVVSVQSKLLSQKAALFYAKQNAGFDFSKCVQVVVFRANAKTESVAAEFKQPQNYSIWIWFDEDLNVIVRESPRDAGDFLIPQSPQFSN